MTHVVDAEQRSVVLPIVRHTAGTLDVQLPDANVVPPGPYLLFINTRDNEGLVPSVAAPLRITMAANP